MCGDHLDPRGPRAAGPYLRHRCETYIYYEVYMNNRPEKIRKKKRNKASSENQLLFHLLIIKDCESFQTVSPTGSKAVGFNTTI
jgi:hypothetical protein